MVATELAPLAKINLHICANRASAVATLVITTNIQPPICCMQKHFLAFVLKKKRQTIDNQ
jgi:hypothetical protein